MQLLIGINGAALGNEWPSNFQSTLVVLSVEADKRPTSLDLVPVMIKSNHTNSARLPTSVLSTTAPINKIYCFPKHLDMAVVCF